VRSARVRTLAVIGHGMVANKLVESLIRRGAARTWDIVVIGEETEPAYDRVHLSSLFRGTVPTELALADPEVTSDPAVTILSAEKVTDLD